MQHIGSLSTVVYRLLWRGGAQHHVRPTRCTAASFGIMAPLGDFSGCPWPKVERWVDPRWPNADPKVIGFFWVALSFGPSFMIHEQVGFFYPQNSTVSVLMDSMNENPWASLRPQMVLEFLDMIASLRLQISFHGMILSLHIQICNI